MPRESRRSGSRRSGSRRSGSRRRRRSSRSTSPPGAPSYKHHSPFSQNDVKAPPSGIPPNGIVTPERSVQSHAPYQKSPPGPGTRLPGASVKFPPQTRNTPTVVVPGTLRSPSHRQSSKVTFDSSSPAQQEVESYHSRRREASSRYSHETYTPRRSPRRSSTRRSHSRSSRYTSVSPQRNSFDPRDRAPEDRFYEVTNQQHPFGPYQRVVRGSFIIEGLNYAIYAAAGEGSESRRRFTTSLRDDIIATVGQGVRRGDIMLRAAPGPVKGVTLEFDHGTHPAIVDANWGIEFEYAIRSRDEIAQQRIGMMLFSSLQDPQGLDLLETRNCWMRHIDPNTHPSGIFAIPVPELERDYRATSSPGGQYHPSEYYQSPHSGQNYNY